MALEVLVDGKRFKHALKQGYRSGLEIKVKDYLKERKVRFKYESLKIEWEDLMYRTYTPDFILHNGLIIETKGRFTTDDRRKHMNIKKQHPNLELSKGAKTTYALWCDRNNFLYADRVIPEEWLKEKGKDRHPELVEFPYEKIKRR